MGEFRSILDLRLLNMCIAHKMFCLLTAIYLKDAKTQEVSAFCLPGIAHDYKRSLFSYSLAPCSFSRCLDTVLQPLCEQGMRVLFYLDDLVVMVGSKEWAVLHAAQLIVHRSRLGFAMEDEQPPTSPSEYLGVVLTSYRQWQ